MKAQELYAKIKRELAGFGVDNPGLEARWLLDRAIGLTEANLIAGRDMDLTAADEAKLSTWVQRRRQGEPLSRILGEREFWGMTFTVTPDVLDPRPDTETIIEAVLRNFRAYAPARILDLGTGSGCLIVALLHIWPDALGTAIDMSRAALAIARDNARRNNVLDRLSLRQGSWFAPVTGESFDLIVSNPPYIPRRDIENLEIGVRGYDPILALDGGLDGLDSYRIIFSGLAEHLADRGAAFFEIGFGQDEDLRRLAALHGLSCPAIHPDLAGIPRVAEMTRGDK